jgi:hypothetical protein
MSYEHFLRWAGTLKKYKAFFLKLALGLFFGFFFLKKEEKSGAIPGASLSAGSADVFFRILI